jgi:phosphate transport system permease protein
MHMTTHTPPRRSKPIDIRRTRRTGEGIVTAILAACGVVSVFTTIGIVLVLGQEALKFFAADEVTLVGFLTGTRWAPEGGLFGIAPLVTATLTTSVIAMLVAIPIGLAAAIYLSEYASSRAARVLKPVLELLAGVPTVVYGYFALTFVTPLLRSLLGSNNVEVYNMLSAGLVMGIMIIPLVGSISEDALTAVPRSLREASLGLGATKLETTFRAVVPAALSGIIAGVIIGISRAVGETMIVSLASGAGPDFTINPLVGAETMTGHIARISSGDLSYESIDYTSLFAIGLTLFLITFVLNLISRYFVRRFREVY